MKTLMKYELFKVVSDKFFIISFVSLLLLNVITCSFSIIGAAQTKKQAKGLAPLIPKPARRFSQKRRGQTFNITETPFGQIRRPKGCLLL